MLSRLRCRFFSTVRKHRVRTVVCMGTTRSGAQREALLDCSHSTLHCVVICTLDLFVSRRLHRIAARYEPARGVETNSWSGLHSRPPIINCPSAAASMAPSTYAAPTLEERRRERAASWAHFAKLIAIWNQVDRGQFRLEPLPCYTCGGRGSDNWCNACERMDRLGYQGFRPCRNAWTPMCNDCIAANVQCRICGCRVSQAPTDEEMGPVMNNVVLHNA